MSRKYYNLYWKSPVSNKFGIDMYCRGVSKHYLDGYLDAMKQNNNCRPYKIGVYTKNTDEVITESYEGHNHEWSPV